MTLHLRKQKRHGTIGNARSAVRCVGIAGHCVVACCCCCLESVESDNSEGDIGEQGDEAYRRKDAGLARVRTQAFWKLNEEPTRN
jgi:hypothetical protein